MLLIIVCPATAPSQALEKSAGPPVRSPSMIEELRHRGLLFPVPRASVKLENTFRQRRGSSRLHYALDIPARRGDAVLSVDSGRILKLHRTAAGGLMVYTADSKNRYIFSYAHLDRYQRGLREGQALSRGDTLGYVGTTGNAPPNAPHLHFAILRSYDIRRWSKGTPINPYMIFAEGTRPDLLAK